MTEFAKRLDILKSECGKTFNELAKDTGIPKSNLATWCRSNAMPNSKSLMVLSRYFDVSVDWLLGLSNFRKIKR